MKMNCVGIKALRVAFQSEYFSKEEQEEGRQACFFRNLELATFRKGSECRHSPTGCWLIAEKGRGFSETERSLGAERFEGFLVADGY